MIGLGGGVIVVPVLTFLTPTAAASNSLSYNAIASTISYSKQKTRVFIRSKTWTVICSWNRIRCNIRHIIWISKIALAYIFLRKKIESKRKEIEQLCQLCRNHIFFLWNRWRNCVCSINGSWNWVPTSQMILLFASGVIVHSLLGDFLQSGFLAIGSFIGGIGGCKIVY